MYGSGQLCNSSGDLYFVHHASYVIDSAFLGMRWKLECSPSLLCYKRIRANRCLGLWSYLVLLVTRTTIMQMLSCTIAFE